jgi:hypothetical protein
MNRKFMNGSSSPNKNISNRMHVGTSFNNKSIKLFFFNNHKLIYINNYFIVLLKKKMNAGLI